MSSASAPRPLGRLLTAADAGLYRDAAGALAMARAEAAAMRAEAAAALASERERLQRDLAEEADRRLARQLSEGAAKINAVLASLREDVAATIATAVARIVGELDVRDAVTAAAGLALAELSARHSAIVHVHPSCAASARAALEGTGARVVADEALPPDACTLETEAGIVRAGLSDQVALLRTALLSAAAAAPLETLAEAAPATLVEAAHV